MRAGEHVAGLGGAFLLSADPAKLGAWYQDNLELDLEEYGGGHFCVFPVRDQDNPKLVRQPVFAIKPLPAGHTAAALEARSAVIALRTLDLEAPKESLEASGFDIPDIHEEPGTARITRVRDSDGNQLELAEELFPE